MNHLETKLLEEMVILMANLADNVVSLMAKVDALDAKLSALSTPVVNVDLSTVAKADALAAVATQVADIDSKVTPTA